MDTMREELQSAIKERNARRVEEVLARHPEAVREGAESPILLAAYMGADDVLAVLTRDTSLDLVEAAAVNDRARLRDLTAADADCVRAYSHDGWTALHLAAFFGHLDAARALLAAGAPLDLPSTNREGNQPLHAAVAGRCSPAVVSLLIEGGADPNAKANGGHTPVHLAAARGELAVLEALVSAGGDARAETDSGQRPLHFARARGHAEAAAWLEGRAR
jgi:ankyrin repeat protein